LQSLISLVIVCCHNSELNYLAVTQKTSLSVVLCTPTSLADVPSFERRRMKRISLKGASLDQLIALRDDIDRMLSQQAAAERRSLEERLEKLSRFSGGGGSSRRGSSLKGRKVPPKYRNPKNPSETWAGRGGTPRWLKEFLKQGKKLEDFAIKGVSAAKRAVRGRGRRKAA
jgi:DNA-binding protein H-NS